MNFVTPKKRQEWLFLQRTKYILPHLARLCLISTFIEDGMRMWMQWGQQRDYIKNTWHVGWFLGTLFVIINMFGQLIPCGMILIRKKTDIACGILFFIIAFQAMAYQVIWELRFLLRSLSLVGGLMLLMVENRKEARSLFAGVPTIHNNAPKNYMQLAGRILLVIMFLTIVRFEFTFFSIIKNIIGGICILCVAIGIICDIEMNLTRTLLNADVYDKSIRPALNHRDVTNVSFDLSLAQLIDVDEKNQIITTNQWITMIWRDPKLRWNPLDWDNVSLLHIKYDKVWLPDIVLYNVSEEKIKTLY
ncbi:unnamed protein product [Rotaria sp. Silwood1]|nr:unnamed protein product [Rotaria sp. Silwood1]